MSATMNAKKNTVSFMRMRSTVTPSSSIKDLQADEMALRKIEYALELGILCHREKPPVRDAAIP
jgi:hypothetical protein